MSRRQPGEIVHTSRRGVVTRYFPSQGSSARYTVACPHGQVVNARTQTDAREDARLVDDWCDECAGTTPAPQNPTTQKPARDLRIDDIVSSEGREYEVTCIDYQPGYSCMGVTMHGEDIEFTYGVDELVTVRA